MEVVNPLADGEDGRTELEEEERADERQFEIEEEELRKRSPRSDRRSALKGQRPLRDLTESELRRFEERFKSCFDSSQTAFQLWVPVDCGKRNE